MENEEIDQAEFEVKLEATLDEAEKWWENLEPEEKATIFITKTELRKDWIKDISKRIENIMEWGDDEEKSNNIYRKSADELNQDWIQELEGLLEELKKEDHS